MKHYEMPWSVGSMFICNKCGAAFNNPNQAEQLKSELRTQLKADGAHAKVRVMVSGCLNVCVKPEQAVLYQPNEGSAEVFTVDQDFAASAAELKEYLKKKI